MKYEITKQEKDRMKISFIVKDKETNMNHEIRFYKFYIPPKVDINKRVEEIKKEYSDLTFSDKLIPHYDTPGSVLKAYSLPLELQNEEFYIYLLTYHALTLDYIDDDNITYNMAKIAVINNPLTLKDVPKQHRSDEIIKIALTSNGVTLQYLPYSDRTDEYCMIAFESSPSALRYMKKELITLDMCINAVTRYMYCLSYVPDEYLLEVYQKAIVDRGLILPQSSNKKYTPEEWRYKDLVELIKKRLQYKTAMEIGMLSEDLTLEETSEKTHEVEALLQRRKELLDELESIQTELQNITKKTR